jgi:hypothetical protein
MFPLQSALVGGFFLFAWTWVLSSCTLLSQKQFFGCFVLLTLGRLSIIMLDQSFSVTDLSS